jgi:hypothetical protein
MRSGGESFVEVARAVGVDERTVRRWAETEDFREAVLTLGEASAAARWEPSMTPTRRTACSCAISRGLARREREEQAAEGLPVPSDPLP